MNPLQILEACAVVFSLIGAYLTADKSQQRQRAGFTVWMFSNGGLFIYSLARLDYGLLVLYGVFLAMSVKGVIVRRLA